MLVFIGASGVRRSYSADVVLTSGVQKGGNAGRERISAIEVKAGGGGGVALNPSHIFSAFSENLHMAATSLPITHPF